jgi:hypothetical protein
MKGVTKHEQKYQGKSLHFGTHPSSKSQDASTSDIQLHLNCIFETSFSIVYI